MKDRLLKLERGERVAGVVNYHLTEMQFDGNCDHCDKKLPRDTRVFGKIVNIQKGITLTARFSPTCMTCADIN